MRIFKNPAAFCVPLDPEGRFYIAVNPQIPNGHQVINKAQMRLMDLVGQEGATAEDISRSCGWDLETTKKIVEILEKKEFISSENNFRFPKSPGKPKSLDVWVHTTNSCNLACTYCYIHKDGRHMSQAVIDEFSQKIVHTAEKWKLEEVHLRLAGGEPTLRFGIWKSKLLALREQLAKINCRLTIGFLTNLTKISADFLEFIKEERCNISVSIDGIGEYHDRTRKYKNGSGSFSDIEKNINELLAHDIRPFVLVVVSPGNLPGLPALTEFLVKKDLGFRFSLVKGEELDQKETARILHKCYDIIEENLAEYSFSKKHRLCDLSFSRPITFPCASARSSFAIDTEGNIHLCQLALAEDKPIGSMKDGDDLLEIARNQTQYSSVGMDSAACGECCYKHLCAGGCPLNRKNGKSIYCRIFQEFIPRIYQLIGKEKLLKVLGNNRA